MDDGAVSQAITLCLSSLRELRSEWDEMQLPNQPTESFNLQLATQIIMSTIELEGKDTTQVASLAAQIGAKLHRPSLEKSGTSYTNLVLYWKITEVREILEKIVSISRSDASLLITPYYVSVKQTANDIEIIRKNIEEIRGELASLDKGIAIDGVSISLGFVSIPLESIRKSMNKARKLIHATKQELDVNKLIRFMTSAYADAKRLFAAIANLSSTLNDAMKISAVKIFKLSGAILTSAYSMKLFGLISRKKSIRIRRLNLSFGQLQHMAIVAQMDLELYSDVYTKNKTNFTHQFKEFAKEARTRFSDLMLNISVEDGSVTLATSRPFDWERQQKISAGSDPTVNLSHTDIVSGEIVTHKIKDRMTYLSILTTIMVDIAKILSEEDSGQIDINKYLGVIYLEKKSELSYVYGS